MISKINSYSLIRTLLLSNNKNEKNNKSYIESRNIACKRLRGSLVKSRVKVDVINFSDATSRPAN